MLVDLHSEKKKMSEAKMIFRSVFHSTLILFFLFFKLKFNPEFLLASGCIDNVVFLFYFILFFFLQKKKKEKKNKNPKKRNLSKRVYNFDRVMRHSVA